MNKKFPYLIFSLSLICVSFILPFNLSGQACKADQEFEAVRMAHSIMKRNPNVYYKWDYVTGTVLRGFQELWLVTKDPVYLDYTISTIEAAVTNDGTIPGYSISEYNIDHVKTGSTLLFLYRETGLEKYKKAADLLKSQLDTHPRTSEGGFWHKNIYPHQMWLDGLYMSTPFLAEYSLMFDHPEGFDDVVNQLVIMEQHARDPETGLLYHGWDESGNQSWADPVTKTSPSFWGRAVGWYALALVDVLDFLPESHQGYDQVVAILQRLAVSLEACRDEDTGLWYQVLDQGGREGNYLESSASSMFVYALAKGVRKGYLDISYLELANRAFESILQEFVTENPDGTINLTRNCYTAGLGLGRDGSYEYYVYETTINQNDGKGLGPFLTASVEVEVLNRIVFPIGLKIEEVTADFIRISWEDRSDNETGFLIERCQDEGFVEIGLVDANQTIFNDDEIHANQVYYYRVRAYNEDENSYSSNVVGVSTLGEDGRPALVSQPQPDDEAIQVTTDLELTWQQGFGATVFDVYMGTGMPLTKVGETAERNFMVNDLEPNTTYFWKVDARNQEGVTEGPVWSFTTEPPKMMVGYWPLDDMEDGLVSDLSGFSNHGSAINMFEGNVESGIVGNAFSFNGTSQYVQVPHHPVFDFSTESFTVMFWMKQNPEIVDHGKEYRYVIKGSHINNPTIGRSGNRYEVYYKPETSQFRFAIDDDVVKSEIFASPELFVTGDWVHVTAVRDAGTRKIHLYADASLVSSGNDATSDISQDEDLYFGYSNDFGSHFEGMLDEVKLFNFALSIEEIGSFYQDRVPVSVENTNILPDNRMLHIYPNPVCSHLNMAFNLTRSSIVKLSIYDISGINRSLLINQVFASGPHNLSFTLKELGNLEAGVYFCVMETAGGRLVEKLIVKQDCR